MLRWQLGFPGTAVPSLLLGDLLPETIARDGVLLPQGYNGLFTMHATFMMFFAVVPLLVGFGAHYLLPTQIGSQRMAYPAFGPLSFWMILIAGLTMIGSFAVEGGPAGTGWTAYPPLSAVEGYTGVGLGQDLWIVSMVLYGLGLLLVAVNVIVTVVNHRVRGMTMFRMPLHVWSQFVTAILIGITVPVLAVALLLLLSDRLFETSFFLPADLKMSGIDLRNVGGGEPLLWQHLFWFFGHPVVYIMILAGMGGVSDILPVFSRKPLFGYRAMVVSTIAIAFLGLVVWGHHMFQTGLNPLMRSGFMLATMLIAVPSALKVFNWIATLWRGRLEFRTPMLFSLGFISMFVIGGLSGVFMASTPVDMFIHDTYFIVGHIHYVLFGGSLFAIFAGVYFWYPNVTGRMLSERLGIVHFWLTFIAFNCVFFPMHILGMGGHMRRVFDPTAYDFLQPLQPMNEFMTISAIVLGLAQLPFLYNLIRSRTSGADAGPNPWRAATLEWRDGSEGGKSRPDPIVYRGPYEYSVPTKSGEVIDVLPQDLETDSTELSGEKSS